MFKWVCLLVAVVALAGFGWMLNDMRLQVKELAENAEKQLREVKGLTAKADTVLSQAERVTKQLDDQVPKLLKQTEQAVGLLDRQLPQLLASTEMTATNINQHLPILLSHTEIAVDSIADLAGGFKQYKGLMGVVHAATQDKGMFSYATSLLDLVDGQDATIGVKKSGGLKHAVSAKEWAKTSRNEAHFVSLGAKSKEDVLHGLAKTHSAQPWYIQIADKGPRLLSEWFKETHKSNEKVK